MLRGFYPCYPCYLLLKYLALLIRRQDYGMELGRSLAIAALGPVVIHATQHLCFCASLALYVLCIPMYVH